MTELDLFAAALAIHDPRERAAFLHRECAGQPAVMQRLDELLAAHAKSHALLDVPNRVDPGATGPLGSPSSATGKIIAGRYKLLEEIGDGGMGSVWMAEQREPVKRLVAVKLIKAGLESRAVLARFEAERQALALMDHPNIAKVLDGGAMEDGRPFFVMELVKGLPLTEYSDTRKLSLQARLELFSQVCSAVQHAHQKGVIHRDLKPSNILVTEHDGRPIPKVIDFGLAKATNATNMLTDKTLHTAFGAVVGTVLYMAPEQVGINALDVDTRTDIYSLGVILYELLTGSTPLERKRLRQAAWDETCRLIREEEPPRPSFRLSTSNALPSLAASRQIDPQKLTGLVRGDLDWIVMKALEKDRNRRYETANGLAMDIQRHLTGEPVLAVPPSNAYRLRKFARKHRAALTTVCTIISLLVAGIGFSTWYAVRASRAEVAARQAELQASQKRQEAIEQRQIAERRTSEALQNESKAREAEESSQALLDFIDKQVFGSVIPTRRGIGLGRNVTMLEAINAAEPKIAAAFGTRPRVEARLRMMLVGAFNNLGDTDRAEAQLERAYSLAPIAFGPDDPFTCDVERLRAYELYVSGRADEATRQLEESLARRRRELGPMHPMTRKTIADLAWHYHRAKRLEDARKLAEMLLQTVEPFDPESEDPEQAWRAADVYSLVGNRAERIRRCEALLPKIIAKLGPDDPQTLSNINDLGNLLGIEGRAKDAIALLEPAYPRAVRVLGANDPLTLSIMQNLTANLPKAERYADAARVLEEALPVLRESYGAANPALGPHYINLSYAYGQLDRHQDRVNLFESAIAAVAEKDRATYLNFEFFLWHLAEAYHRLGDTANTHRVAAEWENWIRGFFESDDKRLRTNLFNLGDTYIDFGMFVDAERVLREVLTTTQSQEPLRQFYVMTCLGGSLLKQKKFAEAEPLLVKGYEGMKEQGNTMKPYSNERFQKVLDWLIELYSATDNPERVTHYQQLRAQHSDKKPLAADKK